MATTGRNDPCHCASGKKYKHCCLQLEESRPKLVDTLKVADSLRDRNHALLIALNEIFRLDQPWEKVKSGMTDARIKEFFDFAAALWPTDTNLAALLPTPDSSLRALYLGEYDPEAMVENVFRFSLYADEIILINPFDNPNCLADKYNPVVHPEEWRMQTLRIVYHLRILAPWIAAGLVTLIPDPGDFDYALRTKTWAMGTERIKKNPVTREDVEISSAKNRAMDYFLMAPPEYLAEKIRESDPTATAEMVEKVLEYVAFRKKNDPLLLDQNLDQMPGQLQVYKTGTGLELGLYLCQTMGAFPYTNIPFRWREIMTAGDQLSPDAQVWSPLTKAFGNLDFKFLDNVDPNFAVTMRKEGRLESFRSYTRKLWKTVGGELDLNKADSLARDFRDELTDEYAKAQADWAAIDRDLLKWGVPAIAGAAQAAVSMATGHYNLALPGGGFAVKGVSELIQSHLKRKEFRKKTPLSVFIDLEKKR
jgi:hypothetical protein